MTLYGVQMKTQIILNNTTILVTGAAGFIGANLVLRLLRETDGSAIIGIDNLNDYYDVNLKHYRIGLIEKAAKKSKSKWQLIKSLEH